MENEKQQPTGEAQNSQKKEWYKNWWGLIVALIILPIFLIWYIWARTKWGKTLKITLTVVVVFFTMIAIASNSSNPQPQQQTSTPAPAPQATNSSTNNSADARASAQETQQKADEEAKVAQETQQKADEEASKMAEEAQKKSDEEAAKKAEVDVAKDKLIEERKNFDKNRGNNAEAASTANGYIIIMKEIGKIDNVDMFLQLDAPSQAEQEFNDGGNLGTYRSKVTMSDLMVSIGNMTWEYSSDSTKKDLVATWVKGLLTLYPNASPFVTVNNGIRTVAEGSWSFWSGEPKIELK